MKSRKNRRNVSIAVGGLALASALEGGGLLGVGLGVLSGIYIGEAARANDTVKELAPGINEAGQQG